MISYNCLVWVDKARNKYENMAIDELLLRYCCEFDQMIFRIYSWTEDTASIGYMQNVEMLGLKGGGFVRRLTGGGVVPHNKKTLTYSFVFPKTHFVYKDLEREKTYEWVHNVFQKYLYDQLAKDDDIELSKNFLPSDLNKKTMHCMNNPTKYDVVMRGRKIMGAAQRRTKDGLLHQGVLDLKKMKRVYGEVFDTLVKYVESQFLVRSLPIEFINFIMNETKRKILYDKYSSKKWNLMY